MRFTDSPRGSLNSDTYERQTTVPVDVDYSRFTGEENKAERS